MPYSMNSQIQFETNGLSVLVVKVPETSKFLHIKSNSKGLYLQGAVKNENNHHSGYTSEYLPSGTDWKILCTTDTEITDEQLEVLLPTTHKYRRFSHLMEILRSNGINPNEKHVILIEEK